MAVITGRRAGRHITGWWAGRGIVPARRVHRPVGESRMAVAVVSDEIFLGIDRASVTVAAHVDRVGG